MSLYRLGLTVDRSSTIQLTPYQKGLRADDKIGGFQIWRGVKTPAMIRDEIERIHAEWLATSKDITREVEAAGGYPETGLQDRPDSAEPYVRFYADVWSPAYQGWEAFRNSHQSWTSNLWGDTWDEAQVWQEALIKIRDKARKVGYKLAYSMEPVKQPDDSLTSGIQALLWTILKFSIIGGAVFLLFLFISKKIGA